MGNNTSTISESQQGLPSSKARGAAAGMPGGREREQSALPPADMPKVAVARYTAPQSNPQSRIVVDIRSSNLDKDYNVYIKQEPQRDLPVDIASAWSGLQAIGALCITVLTIQKLWEDIKFIRLLRRELSSLVGSLTDAGGGLDAGSGDGIGHHHQAPRPARTRGASGRPNSSCSGPPERQLDLHLSELSELLGGGRGTTSAQQQQQEATNANVASPAASHSSGNGNLGGTAHSNNSTTAHTTAAADPPALMRKDTTWSSISGLLEVKILLQEATVLPTLRPDLFQGIRQPPKALLLFGPPGTGKTLLARAVATESRATFLPVTGSSVLSMWYGQSEQNVKALFEKARKRQPAIIFIDEVDSLLGKRSSGGPRDSTPDKRVTNEFLAFIDGIQTQQGQQGGSGGVDGGDNRIVVIAATNTPWDLDEAALSRFSRRIYVPLPDRGTREALMRKAMEGIACDVSSSEWQRLAERCDKYSGRDLVQVCREAAMRPLRELWGRRLLEGSPPSHDSDTSGPVGLQQTAAAQQRLVELVANSLATSAAKAVVPRTPTAANADRRIHSGDSATDGNPTAAASSSRPVGPQAAAAPAGWLRRFGLGWASFGGNRYTHSKKQARRELERWKRRHGATWCNVDLIMEQAERLLESRKRGEQQADGRAESRASGEAAAEGVSAGEQDQGQGQGGSSAPSRQQQQPEGASATEAAALTAGSFTEAMKDEEAARHVRVRVQLQMMRAAAGASAVEEEEDSKAGDRPSGAQIQVRLQVQVGGSATEDGGKSAGAECAAAAAAADTPVTAATSATATSLSGAATAAAPVCRRSGGGVTAAAAAGTKGNAAGAAEGCVAAGPAGSTAAAKSSNAAAAAQAARGASSCAGAEEGDSALSLEGLLALPATRVRPVTAADLEAALQVISCTEMDQTSRYTEWDEQYGSGVNQPGRQGSVRGKVWMSMYA